MENLWLGPWRSLASTYPFAPLVLVPAVVPRGGDQRGRKACLVLLVLVLVLALVLALGLEGEPSPHLDRGRLRWTNLATRFSGMGNTKKVGTGRRARRTTQPAEPGLYARQC